MNKKIHPEEPETINCETCLTEIPPDEAQSAEGEDYVVHFCGLECYSKWKEQAGKKAPEDSKK